MKMVDGVVLVVDAYEGTMPQTRFVLKKALEQDLVPIVVVNKIDKPSARPEEVVDEVLELFIELGADDDQLDFPVVYASAINGTSSLSDDPADQEHTMAPIFDTIIDHIPAPVDNSDEPLQFQVSLLDYNDFVGRIGNIDAVNGQAYSGIMHGIGFALKEDYADVKKHANMFGAGTSYIKDVPDDINLIHIDGAISDGPFGSSGASEAFQASGHCAVLNGIYNACGVRIHEIPALPEKVKAGLDAIAKGEKPYEPKKYFLGSDMYEELENIKENPVQVGTQSFYVSLDDPTAERPF